MSTYSQPFFSSFGWVWMCKLGVTSQEWMRIEVKLLRMTLRDPEWPFHASRAVSAVAEFLVDLGLRL